MNPEDNHSPMERRSARPGSNSRGLLLRSRSGMLAPRMSGRRILLGVTGSIAAYKAAELTRLLKKRGFEVQVVMTAAASRFVAPLTFGALTAKPVITDVFQLGAVLERPSGIEHV